MKRIVRGISDWRVVGKVLLASCLDGETKNAVVQITKVLVGEIETIFAIFNEDEEVEIEPFSGMFQNEEGKDWEIIEARYDQITFEQAFETWDSKPIFWINGQDVLGIMRGVLEPIEINYTNGSAQIIPARNLKIPEKWAMEQFQFYQSNSWCEYLDDAQTLIRMAGESS